MQSPRFQKYKDSNILWTTKIPSHWESQKGKWLFKKESRPVRKKDEVITCFRDGEVTLRSNRRTDGFTNALQEHGYQGIRKGDLVIHAMDAFAGAIGVSDSEGKSTPVYSVCTPTKIFDVNPFYYAYLLRYMALSGFILSLAKGIRERSTDFRFNDFASQNYPVPPIEEQNRIVNFLDQKTAAIDTAIAKKQRLIELFKEQKAIMINRAVTRGLNPDVPMKDSGVEWIGEIPAHWSLKKLKFSTKIFRGKFTHRPRNDPKLYDGPYPFVQTGDVAKASKFITTYKQTLNEKGLRVSTLVPEGTVVITIAANIGDIAILGFDACFPDSVVGFKPHQFLERDYLYFMLLAMKQQFISSTTQNTQMNLNVESVGSNFITIPSIEEQKNIFIYLNKKNVEIDNLIVKLGESITKLQEYKQTLIAHAVTGKIKVS